ncbi:hypothetical protein KY289_010689 [Solanum tuberosum]|nr:hypothetical protein KY289_010689 [Solanum tuberosum]
MGKMVQGRGTKVVKFEVDIDWTTREESQRNTRMMFKKLPNFVSSLHRGEGIYYLAPDVDKTED